MEFLTFITNFYWMNFLGMFSTDSKSAPNSVFLTQLFANFKVKHARNGSQKRRNSLYTCLIHCKFKIPKFGNKYSQKRNIGVSVPISTVMRLWVTYIFPRSVYLFFWRKYVDRSWDYMNRSQTHEWDTWMWKLGLRPRYSKKRNT